MSNSDIVSAINTLIIAYQYKAGSVDWRLVGQELGVDKDCARMRVQRLLKKWPGTDLDLVEDKLMHSRFAKTVAGSSPPSHSTRKTSPPRSSKHGSSFSEGSNSQSSSQHSSRRMSTGSTHIHHPIHNTSTAAAASGHFYSSPTHQSQPVGYHPMSSSGAVAPSTQATTQSMSHTSSHTGLPTPQTMEPPSKSYIPAMSVRPMTTAPYTNAHETVPRILPTSDERHRDPSPYRRYSAVEPPQDTERLHYLQQVASIVSQPQSQVAAGNISSIQSQNGLVEQSQHRIQSTYYHQGQSQSPSPSVRPQGNRNTQSLDAQLDAQVTATQQLNGVDRDTAEGAMMLEKMKIDTILV
ncbi:hypothetical protein V1511DRAFT_310811 [Dipodascopsis uninucleata]